MGIRLSEKAMLVSLSISQWTARKKDKRATSEIHDRYNADDKSGQYNKALIAKDRLETIRQTATAAREEHYKLTLPWLDTGARILPSAMFDQYSQAMRDHRARFEQAVREFLTNYEAYVHEARYRLNGLYDPADYPQPEEMAAKFSFSCDVLPLPDAADFRVQLQAEDMERLQRNTQQRIDQAQAQATQDLYGRLAEVVGRMAERLGGDEKKTFRNSLVENVRELVDLIPGLNVTQDPRIEEIRQAAADRLTKYEPDTLRENSRARQETAQAAQDIMDKMSAYMG